MKKAFVLLASLAVGILMAGCAYEDDGYQYRGHYRDGYDHHYRGDYDHHYHGDWDQDRDWR